MSRISDENIDRITRTLLSEARLGDEELDEIADAPQLWWSVRSGIGGRSQARPLWLRFFDWRLVPVAAILLIGVSGVVLRTGADGSLAVSAVGPRPEIQFAPTFGRTRSETEALPAPAAPVRTVAGARRPTVSRTVQNAVPRPEGPGDTNATAEVRSEFIALMYSSAPESGQLVKVKVPRSMMVSLGVSADVSSEAGFVDAEVLMGNDGSARAIRFIR
jgi:hypothetical protein